MPEDSTRALRQIPSVTFLLTFPQFEEYLALYPRTLILQVLRDLLARKREQTAGRPADGSQPRGNLAGNGPIA